VLDWLIIGGGVHGTLLSHHLTLVGEVPPERLRVLDPHPTPLWCWERFTRNTGMEYLRSPSVHHLGVNPFELDRFARRQKHRQRPFAWPYDRPALWLFRRHCEHLVEEHGLARLRVQGRAAGLSRTPRGLRVETAEGALEARRVVLALGLGESLCLPEWAQELRAAGASVHHIFEAGFRRERLPAGERLIIVGGGISALQLALSQAERAPGSVLLLSRHEVRVQQFDSDPGWLGPRSLRRFWQVPSAVERRRIITQARHRGSAPQEVARAVGYAVREGRLRLAHGAVVTARQGPEQLELEWSTEQGERRREPCDRLVLATGFEPARPGGAWVERAIQEQALRCAPCGYPLVDHQLQWAPGLHVSGPLAELELGPVSRNIAGARMAAERLVPVARGG
jgi:cation diffusion facilitator CzcD-associated flavoprotein CzcO